MRELGTAGRRSNLYSPSVAPSNGPVAPRDRMAASDKHIGKGLRHVNPCPVGGARTTTPKLSIGR
jgi:hypothetical protein